MMVGRAAVVALGPVLSRRGCGRVCGPGPRRRPVCHPTVSSNEQQEDSRLERCSGPNGRTRSRTRRCPEAPWTCSLSTATTRTRGRCVISGTGPPRVRPGGIIAGHDYSHAVFPEVVQAVHETLPKGKTLYLAPDFVFWWIA